MSEREVVVARRNGVVRGPDGERIAIRAGRTIADADHPVVAMYPKAFVPVNVTLRTKPADRDELTQLPPAEGVEPTGADPETIELAEQFRRLAAALRGLDVLPDQPLTAAEVVEHTVAIVDDWKRPENSRVLNDTPMTHDVDDEGDAEPALRPPREQVREWAKSQGLQVGEKGRLSDSVYAAYDEAHPRD